MSAIALTGAPTRRISSAEEARAVADALATVLAPGAADRDRDRAVPHEELHTIAASGLLGAPVPSRYGGAGISAGTQADVLRRLAIADPSLAQILLPHFVLLGAVGGLGSEALRESIFTDVIGGGRIGNAISERGTPHAWDPQSRLVKLNASEWRLDGRKYYATGALTAEWIGVSAKDAQGRVALAFVPRGTEGVEITDEWTAFGQRATISGPATFDGVRVPADHVLPLWQAFEEPTTGGAFDQLLHAAIDIGIARAALDDGAAYVRDHARPWFEAEAPRAEDEPELVARAGQIASRVIALEAAFQETARLLDAVQAAPITATSAARASVAVAALKAFAGEVAVETASALFELTGTSATDDRHRLDRHWRNARTHTLHDPVRWKYQLLGNWVLNGIPPQRHDWN